MIDHWVGARSIRPAEGCLPDNLVSVAFGLVGIGIGDHAISR
jgi:hypothetical protein